MRTQRRMNIDHFHINHHAFQPGNVFHYCRSVLWIEIQAGQNAIVDSPQRPGRLMSTDRKENPVPTALLSAGRQSH